MTPQEILEKTSVIAMRPQIFLYDVPKHVVRPKAFGWIDPAQYLAYFRSKGQEE